MQACDSPRSARAVRRLPWLAHVYAIISYELFQSLLVFLRTLGVRLGIIRRLQSLRNLIRSLRRREHESEVRSALIQHIHPGQVIWDVGANEGLYVDLMLEFTTVRLPAITTPAHERLGAADCGERGEPTGVAAEGLDRRECRLPTTTAPETARRSCPRSGKQ